ncbi:MAG: hypothetical protein WC759_01340 [Candidatus Micrarchaeia archaeon]
MITSAIGLGVLSVFGHAPAKPVVLPVNGRPAIVRDVSEFFGAKTAFAEQSLSKEGQINKEEALALLDKPLQKQEAVKYRLRTSGEAGLPEDIRNLLDKVGGKAYVSDVYIGSYRGEQVAIGLQAGSTIKIRIGSADFSVDLTQDFSKQALDPDTAAVWSKSVQFAIVSFGSNKLPAVVIADKGEDSMLVVNMVQLNQDQIGVTIRHIDMVNFRISGAFSLSTVSARENSDYVVAFFYDEVERMGAAMLFDGGSNAPEKYLCNIMYYPIEDYSPKAADIRIAPYMKNGEMRLLIADPTWIGDSRYVGNGLMEALSDIYLVDPQTYAVRK